MVKRRFIIGAIISFQLIFALHTTAQTGTAHPPTDGKEIYIPKDLRQNDFTDPQSKWSYARMACTDDVVIFWEKPFGDDPAKAPDLEGHNMKVDIPNLLRRIGTFYNYFKDELKFVLPGSKSEKYRMMVMLNYSLEGTAYGGDYDETIGALWIAPNRVQDEKLNCIAHELGHSFQSQIGSDGTGESWGGGGIFEMTSQWMLWQVNPEWTTDENFHWKGFIDGQHKRLFDISNIYHSPYVLEYWAMKHGKTAIADLFRAGKRGEDPASTYMRIYGLNVEQMNYELTDCYSRLIAFDYPRVKESHKKFVGEIASQTITLNSNKTVTYSPTEKNIPETWGFNTYKIVSPKDTKTLTIKIDGNDSPNATYATRLVQIDKNGNILYSKILSGTNTKHKVKVQEGTDIYIVVVGCPKDEYKPYTFNPYERDSKENKEQTYPYTITINK